MIPTKTVQLVSVSVFTSEFVLSAPPSGSSGVGKRTLCPKISFPLPHSASFLPEHSSLCTFNPPMRLYDLAVQNSREGMSTKFYTSANLPRVNSNLRFTTCGIVGVECWKRSGAVFRLQRTGLAHHLTCFTEPIAFQAPYGGSLILLVNVHSQCISVHIFSDLLQAEWLYRPSVIPKALFR